METGELGRLNRQVERGQESVIELRIEVALILERLAHAIGDKDLKQLESDIMAAVDVKIGHICEHLTGANREQSKDLMAEWRRQREADSQLRSEEMLADREAIIGAIKDRRSKVGWWIMGIIGGLLVTVLGTVAGIMITRSMTGG